MVEWWVIYLFLLLPNIFLFYEITGYISYWEQNFLSNNKDDFFFTWIQLIILSVLIFAYNFQGQGNLFDKGKM